MPVRTSGRKIIEKSTGRVVARGKTAASAKSSARVRNAAHAAKKRGKKLTVKKGRGFRFDGAKSLHRKKKRKR
jgi:hypothetical protein